MHIDMADEHRHRSTVSAARHLVRLEEEALRCALPVLLWRLNGSQLTGEVDTLVTGPEAAVAAWARHLDLEVEDASHRTAPSTAHRWTS